MNYNLEYWTSVIKRFGYFACALIGLFLAFKLSIFYMPFLIAFIISLIIEPCIKFIMKKFNITRKVSSIIIFILVSSIILGSIAWAIFALVSEASNLLGVLNDYMEKISGFISKMSSKFDFSKMKVPEELKGIFINSADGVINAASNWIRKLLNNIINIITKFPTIAIYFTITIMALYLICVDKIYILDQLEHHIPKKWVSKLGVHIRKLAQKLGGYLKAEFILVGISFLISVFGLYLLRIFKFNIQYPFLMAVFIGFVDLLPIVGAGTVMVPWGVISAINGDVKLGISIIILFILMSIIRQFLQPKLISKNIGTHPIFTLIAMYTGFKFLGIVGIVIGPIVIIIFKDIFATLIEDGIIKTLFNKN